MSRKSLPRAVTRTAEDMREAVPTEWTVRDPPASRPVVEPAAMGNVVAIAPLPPAPSGPAVDAPASTSSDTEVARRHALAARVIVERYATYSALGGFIPLPVVNFSSVAAIIVRMVKVLSNHYGVPFERDRTRAIVAALMAGAAPTGLGTVAASTISFFAPGGLFVGMGVSSATAVTCTRTVGRIFVEHLETGATLADFPTFETR
jgi:uncharacterized protein (DUF697 family)